MTNLTKVLTTHFGSLKVDVVKAGQSEPGITRKQLGEMLGYEDPHRSVAKIHDRNRERLDQFSVVVKMTTTDKKSYDTHVYGFKGVLEVCRYSAQPKANAVIDWAWEPRYLITQRSFNGMVDMAIRERVICPPLPKNYCLPFFDEPLPSEAGSTLHVSAELGANIE